MKKLIKNEIYGSVNSAHMHCSLKKVNICGYCSLNSSRTPPAKCENKKKKKKRKSLKRKTQQNVDPNCAIYLLSTLFLWIYISWNINENLHMCGQFRFYNP